MTTIYQVIKAEYIDWEKDDRNVVCVTLDLDEAIQMASKVSEDFFLDVLKEEHSVFIPRFEKFKEFSTPVPHLFNRENPMRHYHHKDVYVVATETGVIVNQWQNSVIDNAVWTMNEDFIFNLFCNDLDKLMERDNLNQLLLDEKTSLWLKFKNNNNLLNNNRLTTKKLNKMNPRRRRLSEQQFISISITGADILAMTAANDEEQFLYEKYEIN